MRFNSLLYGGGVWEAGEPEKDVEINMCCSNEKPKFLRILGMGPRAHFLGSGGNNGTESSRMVQSKLMKLAKERFHCTERNKFHEDKIVRSPSTPENI